MAAPITADIRHVAKTAAGRRPAKRAGMLGIGHHMAHAMPAVPKHPIRAVALPLQLRSDGVFEQINGSSHTSAFLHERRGERSLAPDHHSADARLAIYDGTTTSKRQFG